MNPIEFIQSNGRAVALNPAQVVSVEENGASTLVLLVTRHEVRVNEPYAQVLAALRGVPAVDSPTEKVFSASETAEPTPSPRKRETK